LERAVWDSLSCRKDEVPWPEELDERWSAAAFQEMMTAALRDAGVEGDVSFHCEEFPCIAHLPEQIDRTAVKEALSRSYGDDAHVELNEHGAVGPWGVKTLSFATVMPMELADEQVRERIRERNWKLVHSVTKDFMTER